jgi:hypothetical protein
MSVDTTDPALSTGYFLLLTLLFPVFNIILTKIFYEKHEKESPSNLTREKSNRSFG